MLTRAHVQINVQNCIENAHCELNTSSLRLYKACTLIQLALAKCNLAGRIPRRAKSA